MESYIRWNRIKSFVANSDVDLPVLRAKKKCSCRRHGSRYWSEFCSTSTTVFKKRLCQEAGERKISVYASTKLLRNSCASAPGGRLYCESTVL